MSIIKVNLQLVYDSQLIDRDTLEDLVLKQIEGIQVIEEGDGCATCSEIRILDSLEEDL